MKKYISLIVFYAQIFIISSIHLMFSNPYESLEGILIYFLIIFVFAFLFWLFLLLIGMVYKRVKILLISSFLSFIYLPLVFLTNLFFEGVIRQYCYLNVIAGDFALQELARQCVESTQKLSLLCFALLFLILLSNLDRGIPIKFIKKYFTDLQKNSSLNK